MLADRRPNSHAPPPPRDNSQRMAVGGTALLFLVYLLTSGGGGDSSSAGVGTVVPKSKELGRRIHKKWTALTDFNRDLPDRLRTLRDQHELVGEHLALIQDGTETVEEILHGQKEHTDETEMPPMTMKEIISFLSNYIHQLHQVFIQNKKASYQGIWQAYHDLTVKTLYPWDREYLQRMPERRFDDTIFLSVATYRDENCLNTISWAFEKAKQPDKLHVGMVQQNCEENCRSGILDGGKIEDVEPDEDCHKVFCEGVGKKYCDAGQVRALHINETESLGPYAARYLASKLWNGEQWYMQ
eukprot:scaffold37446_cov48-Attheya_sp.AAC.1